MWKISRQDRGFDVVLFHPQKWLKDCAFGNDTWELEHVQVQVQVSFLLKTLWPNERNRNAEVGVVWSWDTPTAEGARPYSILVGHVVRPGDELLHSPSHRDRMPFREQREGIVAVIDGGGNKSAMQRPMTKAMATMITVFEEGDGMISGPRG